MYPFSIRMSDGDVSDGDSDGDYGDVGGLMVTMVMVTMVIRSSG